MVPGLHTARWTPYRVELSAMSHVGDVTSRIMVQRLGGTLAGIARVGGVVVGSVIGRYGVAHSAPVLCLTEEGVEYIDAYP